MYILRLSSCVSLICCAVSSSCNAVSDYEFWTQEDGYISVGKELEVAMANVSHAKEICSQLNGCKAFYHEGDVDTSSMLEMHFRDDYLSIVNLINKSTSYVLRIGCTSTVFDHCPASGNVRCCNIAAANPQCGDRAYCEVSAEETQCTEFDTSRCPYYCNSQCCGKNGRCVLSDDCAKIQDEFGILEIVLYASLVSLAIVLVMLSFFVFKCCHNRKYDGGIYPGCVVTYHDSRQALLGVVDDWDNDNGAWKIKLRGGSMVHANAENLIIVEKPRPRESEKCSEMAQNVESRNEAVHRRIEEAGTWDYSDGSFKISLDDDQIVFMEGATRAKLHRTAEWLEGDLVSFDSGSLQAGENESVRLKFLGRVKARGKDEILVNYKGVGETEWSDNDIIAVRHNSVESS